jgi:hypothetical protein
MVEQQIIINLYVSLSPVLVRKKRQKGVEEGRRRRNTIHLNGLYTVETVVVADSDMVQYHGAEAAQRFLLTVMNMVRMLEYTHTHMLCYSVVVGT